MLMGTVATAVVVASTVVLVVACPSTATATWLGEAPWIISSPRAPRDNTASA